MAEPIATVEQPHGAEHAEATSLGMDAGGWVALAMLAVFALLIWQKVPKAIGRALDGKIALIRDQLAEAESLRKEAEALKAEYEARAKSVDKDRKALARTGQARGGRDRRQGQGRRRGADRAARPHRRGEDRRRGAYRGRSAARVGRRRRHPRRRAPHRRARRSQGRREARRPGDRRDFSRPPAKAGAQSERKESGLLPSQEYSQLTAGAARRAG